MLKRLIVWAVAGFLMMEVLVRIFQPVLGRPLTFDEPLIQAKIAQMEEIAESGQRVDVLFVGNSTTVEGVDVLSFEEANCCGYQGYNLAFNGADSYLVREMLERYGLPLLKPRVVVWGISPGALSADPASDRTLQIDEEDWKEFLSDRLALYRYRNTLRNPLTVGTLLRFVRTRESNAGIVERQMADLTSDGDEVRRSPTGLPPEPIPVSDLKVVPAPPDEDTLDNVKAVAELVSGSEAQLVLTRMPLTAPNDELASNLEWLSSHLPLTYVDLTPAVDSTAAFADGLHMNLLGAEATGSYLAPRLENILSPSASP